MSWTKTIQGIDFIAVLNHLIKMNTESAYQIFQVFFSLNIFYCIYSANMLPLSIFTRMLRSIFIYERLTYETAEYIH